MGRLDGLDVRNADSSSPDDAPLALSVSSSLLKTTIGSTGMNLDIADTSSLAALSSSLLAASFVLNSSSSAFFEPSQPCFSTDASLTNIAAAAEEGLPCRWGVTDQNKLCLLQRPPPLRRAQRISVMSEVPAESM